MKIILVHNTYQQPGGEDAAFRNEYNLLTKAGHEVVRYVRSNHDVSHYVSVRQLALAKRTIWASDTRESRSIRFTRSASSRSTCTRSAATFSRAAFSSGCAGGRADVSCTSRPACG